MQEEGAPPPLLCALLSDTAGSAPALQRMAGASVWCLSLGVTTAKPKSVVCLSLGKTRSGSLREKSGLGGVIVHLGHFSL